MSEDDFKPQRFCIPSDSRRRMRRCNFHATFGAPLVVMKDEHEGLFTWSYQAVVFNHSNEQSSCFSPLITEYAWTELQRQDSVSTPTSHWKCPESSKSNCRSTRGQPRMSKNFTLNTWFCLRTSSHALCRYLQLRAHRIIWRRLS